MLAFDIESGGRWSLIGRGAARAASRRAGAAAVEYAARALLARYGVVFWRLLGAGAGMAAAVARSAPASTAGSRRAGKFAAAASSPVSPASNSRCRRRSASCARFAASPASGEWVSLSGADPLNLIGILTPGQRLSALTANRVVYRDGLPVAALTGGKAQFLTELETADQWEAEKRLVRSAARGMLADLV